jgi:hypothetical protein|tara:strand:- start:307 stop:972 length:666 start_codon:yes stop_codon:yes gene_type:complete
MGNLQRFDIKGAIDKKNIQYFLETGTLHGDSIEFVDGLKCESIKELHSIELLDELYSGCVKRFEGRNNVHLHKGMSVDVLEEILKNNKLDGNTFFWLDAHYPGADIGKESYIQEGKEEKEVLPLEQELQVIKKYRDDKYDDIIICDDLWIYEDGEYDCPAKTIDNHMKMFCNGETKEQIGKPNADFVEELFGDTHNIEKNNLDQGYIIITPKDKVTNNESV